MEKIFLGEPPANIKQWIIEHYLPSPTPVAPNGKVLYKTEASGEWLQADADITNGTFNGFTERENAVEVLIPSKDASGNDVTSIGNAAFASYSGLTNVTIPNSITNIESYAFSGCSGLTNVIIPYSVTSIGEGAFQDCSALTSMTIPDNMINIGNYAFYNCRGLTSVMIGKSVTSIGSYAFHSCSNLTSVTIPDSVMSIGNNAFYYCRALASVTIVANGGDAEAVKQAMIAAGVVEDIEWIMPN